MSDDLPIDETERPRRSRRDAAARRSTPPSRPSRARRTPPVTDSAARRRTTAALIALAVLVAIVGAIAFGVWSTLYRPSADVPAGRDVTVEVPKGASGEQAAVILANAGVVANANMFRLRASILGAASDIKAGTYTLKTGSAYDDVVRLLAKGPVVERTTVTIPEGWGIPAVAARIQDKLGIPAQRFTDLALTGAKRFDFAFLADNPTDSLEGYLFPKTYEFKAGVDATEVIRVMLTQYGKETAGLDYSYARSKGFNPHDALTIASMIEREAVVESERVKVSSVVYNRVAINMRLEYCSTVQYILGNKPKLTNADLKTPSPYNTYLNPGLPPGPICSPGLPSIKAALAPAKTRYLYFVLTGKNGTQSFATNYADFLDLKAQAKRGLK